MHGHLKVKFISEGPANRPVRLSVTVLSLKLTKKF